MTLARPWTNASRFSVTSGNVKIPLRSISSSSIGAGAALVPQVGFPQLLVPSSQHETVVGRRHGTLLAWTPLPGLSSRSGRRPGRDRSLVPESWADLRTQGEDLRKHLDAQSEQIAGLRERMALLEGLLEAITGRQVA